MSSLQPSLSPQNGPMRSVSSRVPPTAQTRLASGTNTNLLTEDPLEDQDNGWGVPGAIAIELYMALPFQVNRKL